VRGTHFGRGFAGEGDVDELAALDAWTVFCSHLPVALTGDQGGPEGERLALQGLHRVDSAAAFDQKRALLSARDANPPQTRRAINILLFEGFRREPEMRGNAKDIFLGEIDETLLIATGGATGLALEAQERDP